MSQTQAQKKGQQGKKKSYPPSKVYRLLPYTNPTAPIFIQVGKKQKVKINALPLAHAYLQQTFTDEKGNSRTARLKLNSNTIWLDEQIKQGIPANAKPTKAERGAVAFRNGFNYVSIPIVMEYLDTIPQKTGFTGRHPGDVKRPLYEEFDPIAIVDSENDSIRRSAEAVIKILAMDLEQVQDKLITWNGTFFTPPANLKECQNQLVALINESDEAIDMVLANNANLDDEVNVIVNRLASAGVISFDAVKDQVAKKKGDKWIPLKEVSSQLEPTERVRYFVQFVTSDAGKLLLADLRSDIKGLNKALKN